MTDRTIDPDPIHLIAMPAPSPALTVLRDACPDGKGEQFTLRHEPMAAPTMPDAPGRIDARKRCHRIATLTDLLAYHEKTTAAEADAIAFYSVDGVTLVMDDTAETERETVFCTLDRSIPFRNLRNALNRHHDHEGLLNLFRFLRRYAPAESPHEITTLIDFYASIRGELIHDSDEYLDRKAKSATFTVKQKRRGGKEKEVTVEDVPVAFRVEVPILPDDVKPTMIEIEIDASAGSDGGIMFRLQAFDLPTLESEHIDRRLQEFADDATAMEQPLLTIRGEFNEVDWIEPKLPESIGELMSRQAEQLQAIAAGMAGRMDD
jgi:hypothetical protein